VGVPLPVGVAGATTGVSLIFLASTRGTKGSVSVGSGGLVNSAKGTDCVLSLKEVNIQNYKHLYQIFPIVKLSTADSLAFAGQDAGVELNAHDNDDVILV